MARHLVSHPVTVTERDTVLRASRHIRPPIRGGVNVTRDQKVLEDVLGWVRVFTLGNLEISTPQQFTRLNRRRRLECHQPARRRGNGIARRNPPHVLPSLSGTSHVAFQALDLLAWQVRSPALGATADVAERAFARALSAILTLSERKTRARLICHAIDTETPRIARRRPRRYAGWEKRQPSLRYYTSASNTARPVSKIPVLALQNLAAATSEKLGRP